MIQQQPAAETMTAEPNVKERLLGKLAASAQEHLLAFWDELGEADRRTLAAQIDAIDFAEIDRLFHRGAAHVDWTALARRAEPPPAIQLGATAASGGPDRVRQAGAAALAAGTVGVLIVAGGQGSRLGFPHPKGMFPLGPVSNAPLFQLHFEKAVATSRRYGAAVPVYVMTSPATHAETVAYLARQRRFGLPAKDLVIFCQGTMPAVDAETGKLLLADRSRLCLSPDGHGGVVAALHKSGAADDMAARKLDSLFYFQVDNPLVPVCDPELIGHHLLAGSELTTVVVAKDTPHDRVGNAVSIDGRLMIIEYIDLPDKAAERRTADGSLVFWAGSVGIHVIDFRFLQRVMQQANCLPLHVSRKRVPHVDHRGQLVEPSAPNACKFERFVFDLLPAARHAIVVEADRDQVFGPVKNEPGAARDTAASARAQMVRLHRQWLEAAGAIVAANTPVEISPLFALDAGQVAEKIKPGLRVTRATHFREG